MEEVTEYNAIVIHSNPGWSIYVPEFDRHTYAPHLREIAPMARDLVQVMTDRPIEDITVTVQLPTDLAEAIAAMRRTRTEAVAAENAARQAQQAAATALRNAGAPLRDVAAALGVSHQRVHQIWKGPMRRAPGTSNNFARRCISVWSTKRPRSTTTARRRSPAPAGGSTAALAPAAKSHDDAPVSALADAVLPLIRTRTDVWRWHVANAHGAQMHEAVAILQQAADDDDPAEVFAVTQRAIASALKVIMRADDSSGIIGDACRDLLELHPVLAEKARPPVTRLVDWMIAFQFDNDCDFFTIDPVAYAPALGADGVAAYRARLDERAAALGPRPPEDERWSSPHRFTLDWNARRLAVLDRDVAAIIATHARDRRVAAWLQDTAVALAEIGETAAAIDWAKQATDFGDGHQSRHAADYWCELLAEHAPDQLLAAHVEVFRRWPSSETAGALYRQAGTEWPQYRDEVLERLAAQPRDAVSFAQHFLGDVGFAWQLAHTLHLDDDHTWADLARAYEEVDARAVLPVYTRLVERELQAADARNYRAAARRLKKMRTLAAGSADAEGVDELIAELRERYRRRPRLQQEFDRAGLP